MNRGIWKWFRLETILNINDIKKASWINHIISLDRQYKVWKYVKNETFTLLKLNRVNWKWFSLETNLNNNDIKKASWSNNIISLDRQYKPRNYLEYVSFTFLNSLTPIYAYTRIFASVFTFPYTQICVKDGRAKNRVVATQMQLLSRC